MKPTLRLSRSSLAITSGERLAGQLLAKVLRGVRGTVGASVRELREPAKQRGPPFGGPRRSTDKKNTSHAGYQIFQQVTSPSWL
jgi:hypothetical protein